MKHHVIISGTGRAGTTLLVELLTAAGIDTGYSAKGEIFANRDSGLEQNIWDPDAPYVVKMPFLCDLLDELMATGGYAIDHAIVPVRDLYAAAESRRDVMRRTTSPSAAVTQTLGPGVPGGLWGTMDPAAQEAVLAKKFHRLLHTIARYEIPLTLLEFPRLAQDAPYLYRHIQPIFPTLDRRVFGRCFEDVVRPELIHSF